MPLTWSQGGESTIKTIFINVSQDIGVLCKDLFVGTENDYLESR
jgi:hypothetical protein